MRAADWGNVSTDSGIGEGDWGTDVADSPMVVAD